MCSVHSHYVHAGEEEFADKLLTAIAVADGSYNFCLFHILRWVSLGE